MAHEGESVEAETRLAAAAVALAERQRQGGSAGGSGGELRLAVLLEVEGWKEGVLLEVARQLGMERWQGVVGLEVA